MKEQKKQESKSSEEKDPFDQELEALEKELQSRSDSLSQPSQSDILAKKEADLKNVDQNKKEDTAQKTTDEFDFEKDLLEMEISSSKPENDSEASKNIEKKEETKNSIINNNQINPSKTTDNSSSQTSIENNNPQTIDKLNQNNKSLPENISISKEVTAKVNESIQKLVDTKNSIVDSSPIYSQYIQSSAFNELAMKLIEPKIERWLENNLPQIVERVVQNEIKKMIS